MERVLVQWMVVCLVSHKEHPLNNRRDDVVATKGFTDGTTYGFDNLKKLDWLFD
jgi:hypothetical protein